MWSKGLKSEILEDDPLDERFLDVIECRKQHLKTCWRKESERSKGGKEGERRQRILSLRSKTKWMKLPIPLFLFLFWVIFWFQLFTIRTITHICRSTIFRWSHLIWFSVFGFSSFGSASLFNNYYQRCNFNIFSRFPFLFVELYFILSPSTRIPLVSPLAVICFTKRRYSRVQIGISLEGSKQLHTKGITANQVRKKSGSKLRKRGVIGSDRGWKREEGCRLGWHQDLYIPSSSLPASDCNPIPVLKWNSKKELDVALEESSLS